MKIATKVAIIGTTCYEEMMKDHARMLLTTYGAIVRLPVLDHHGAASELEIMQRNREMIEWADEVHVLWNGHSIGTWGDWSMAFALRKKIRVIYLNPKVFAKVMLQYEDAYENNVCLRKLQID